MLLRSDPPLGLDDAAVAALAERHGVIELAVFGSVLRDDFAPESDVDVLVAYNRAVHPSLFDMAGLAATLEELIDRTVDLVDASAIRPFLRDEILSTRRSVYVKATAGAPQS